MSFIADMQALTNHYGAGIKIVRVICKNGLTQVFKPGSVLNPTPGLNMTTYQQDFGKTVEQYRDMVQEVRVIFKDGAGSSQFFPKGTDERLVWSSVIPKEELE